MRKIFYALSIASLCQPFCQAAPIVDANDNPQPLAHFAQSHTPAPSSSSTLDLLNQVQQLQQQVADLQGQNEVLQHQVQQLQQRQTLQYADLDKRLRALEPKQAATSLPSKSTADANAYQRAYNVIAAGDYAAAAKALQQFIKQYPTSQFVPKAWYWLAEVYAALAKPAQSRAALQTLLKQYPNSKQVPEAKFKLALLAYNQGQAEQAKQQLRQLIKAYPDAAIIGKAKAQLANIEATA